MRAVVALALVALLAGLGDAAPKRKKRRGTFAAYIDPAAPDDPPVPWPSYPTWLSVVFLIDRSAATEGPRLDAAKAAALSLYETLDDWDMAAILAFDESVDYVFRANDFKKRSKKRFKQALEHVTARGTADLAAALDEARNYMAAAPDRKVIVVITDAPKLGDKLDTALQALVRENVTVVVVSLPKSDRRALRELAFSPRRTLRLFDTDPSGYVGTLDDLHYQQ